MRNVGEAWFNLLGSASIDININLWALKYSVGNQHSILCYNQ